MTVTQCRANAGEGPRHGRSTALATERLNDQRARAGSTSERLLSAPPDARHPRPLIDEHVPAAHVSGVIDEHS